MKKDPKIFLQHILESISEIEKYTKGMSEDEFARATQVQDAVIRRLEIIGEAAKNIFYARFGRGRAADDRLSV